MRFGFALPSYGKGAQRSILSDLLIAGEELGFESAWVPDHIAVPSYAEGNMHPPFLEPLATCAWALGSTARITLGTDILVAPYRHPLLALAMCNSIARLAESRFVLGVGIGYLIGEFEALGLDYGDRAKATEEFIRIFRQPPDHLSIVDAHVPPPMWVGGNSSSALKRAALLGDGWHPLWLPPNHYSEARRRITAWRDAARIDSPFTFSFSARFTDFADPPVGGWPPPAPRPPVGSEFRYAPPAWVMSDGRPGLVGTPDQLISDLRDLAEAGVEHITLRFGQVTTASLERFAQEVMPAF